jgi:ribosomal protein S25
VGEVTKGAGLFTEQPAGKDEEEGENKPRFRRKKRAAQGISEELYQRIKSAVISGKIAPTVATLKKEARGTNQAYIVIDRLQSEEVVRQAENGRYQVI